MDGVEKLKEYFEDWVHENRRSADEPITVKDLAEFFEYVDNALWNGR